MRVLLPLVTVALVVGMAKAALAAGAYLARDHRDRATRITDHHKENHHHG